MWRFISSRCTVWSIWCNEYMHDSVRLAVELFGHVLLGSRAWDVDSGADEGARFAFPLVAPRSFGDWLSQF